MKLKQEETAMNISVKSKKPRTRKTKETKELVLNNEKLEISSEFVFYGLLTIIPIIVYLQMTTTY